MKEDPRDKFPPRPLVPMTRLSKRMSNFEHQYWQRHGGHGIMHHGGPPSYL
jgi:hypothetical protein